jgi:pimeloyl-ACP methyl ester carboxylesterase
MRVQTGGEGRPVLVLVHGLGATSDVWNGWHALLDRYWSGRWIAPDLPGHGASRPLPGYTFAALAEAVAGCCDPAAPTTLLGHSLGGVVAVALAGPDSPLAVTRVVGLGIKVAWSPDELERAAGLAARPVSWFDSRAEAAGRYLRVAGLTGLLSPDDPAVDAGLREEGGRWRLALDPAAFGVGAPDMGALLAGSRAPVLLARGEDDPMNTDDQLAALGAPTATLVGLGHNAHVEDPRAVFDLLGA